MWFFMCRGGNDIENVLLEHAWVHNVVSMWKVNVEKFKAKIQCHTINFSALHSRYTISSIEILRILWYALFIIKIFPIIEHYTDALLFN